MKQFLYLCLICFGVLVLLCTGAIFIGHLQPENSFIPEMQPCGIDLCYLGLVPGKTTWFDGLAAIRQAPQLKPYINPVGLYIKSAAPSYIVGFTPISSDADGLGSTTAKIMEIDINLANATVISAGEVVTKWGPPCYLTSSNGDIFLFYTDSIFSVNVNDTGNSLRPESAITHIDLRRAKQESCPTELAPNEFIATYKWQGFRKYPIGP